MVFFDALMLNLVILHRPVAIEEERYNKLAKKLIPSLGKPAEMMDRAALLETLY